MVAKYEAHCQIAYMSAKGTIDCAWTVRGDFVVHGISHVWLKVDYRTGKGYLCQHSKLLSPQSNKTPKIDTNTPFPRSMSRFGSRRFLAYALAAGCCD